MKGKNNGQFQLPTMVSILHSKYLLVAEDQSSKLQVFNLQNGRFLAKVDGFKDLSSLNENDDGQDYVFLTDSKYGLIQKLEIQ